MSTIIIITRPPTKAERSSVESDEGILLENKLQSLIDDLRGMGYDIEIQRPET